MISSSIPTNINISFEIDSNVGFIEADDIQIQQVLMNLCTNAIQAMKKQGEKLTVRLTNIDVDESNAALYPCLPSGQFANLSVSDEGQGIPREAIERIFDPYFTTKPEGSGLGLAIVQNIVSSNKGFMTVESQTGEGATFHVYLPIAQSNNGIGQV